MLYWNYLQTVRLQNCCCALLWLWLLLYSSIYIHSVPNFELKSVKWNHSEVTHDHMLLSLKHYSTISFQKQSRNSSHLIVVRWQYALSPAIFMLFTPHWQRHICIIFTTANHIFTPAIASVQETSVGVWWRTHLLDQSQHTSSALQRLQRRERKRRKSQQRMWHCMWGQISILQPKERFQHREGDPGE